MRAVRTAVIRVYHVDISAWFEQMVGQSWIVEVGAVDLANATHLMNRLQVLKTETRQYLGCTYPPTHTRMNMKHETVQKHVPSHTCLFVRFFSFI